MSAPGDTDRVAIIGRTGSGKTQFACAFLQSRSWDKMPWIILDGKGGEGEKLIADIGKALRGTPYFHKMKVTDKIPSKPGLYHIRFLPDEHQALEDLMMRIWEHGRCGFYIDEGYMLPQALPRWKGYTYLLTQGRSLEIPMIMLYQRPVWLNKFVIEQAGYFAVFSLNSDKDAKYVMDIIRPAKTFSGQIITPNEGLPRYHCLWYDVEDGQTTVLRPAPARADIIKAFADKAGARGKRTGFI